MNILESKVNVYLTILFVLIFTTSTFAQLSTISVGGGIGLGSINGNLPSQTSFGGKIFVEAEPFVDPFNSLQFSFIYAQKLEKLLPQNRTNKYYPFVKSFSLTANGKQLLSENLFVGEGFGFLLLNDRTFNDVNTWNYGLAINFFVGTEVSTKMELTLNLEYGLTLTNTNASFALFILQGKYYL
ncbi:MAG: hypothetical protein V3V16_13455 [Melioribacteraceae bacterium]